MLDNNKKGIELSMSVVVIAILVILVLIFVALFFTGGFTGLIAKLKALVQGSSIEIGVVQSTCNGYCNNFDLVTGASSKETIWNEYCDVKRDIDLNSNGKIDPGEKKSCDEFTTCGSIDCNNPP